MNWLIHIIGLDDASGPWYLFWSGLGSDITEFAIFGGFIALYRKHNCHVNRCWRIGKYPVESSPFTVCRKHHPDIDVAPKAADL